MLNFAKMNILFIALLALCIVGNISRGLSGYSYLFLLCAYALLLFYGCYYIGSNFFINVTCSLKTTEKVIAISFDDGPDAKNTPQILQALRNNGTKAAFFCIGNRVAGNEALLKQVYDEGHLIGNHTFSHHFWFDLFSAKKMTTDMLMMDEVVNDITGKKPKLFRPPYGVTNPNVKKAVANCGYIPVGWSVRSLDTVIKNEKELLDKVTAKLKPGAVFLFHDTSNATVAMLPAFIKYVKSNGYEIIRLDKMLNLQPYA